MVSASHDPDPGPDDLACNPLDSSGPEHIFLGGWKRTCRPGLLNGNTGTETGDTVAADLGARLRKGDRREEGERHEEERGGRGGFEGRPFFFFWGGGGEREQVGV